MAVIHQISRKRHDQFGRQRDTGRLDRHENDDSGIAGRGDDLADEDEQDGEDLFGHESVLSSQFEHPRTDANEESVVAFQVYRILQDRCLQAGFYREQTTGN